MGEHLQQKALAMFEQTEMFVRTFFMIKPFLHHALKGFWIVL